jgi:uncharacterized membrane protein YhfC
VNGQSLPGANCALGREYRANIDMLMVAFIIEILFVVGFPLALGIWFHRRLKVSWLLFAAGAVTFGLSQAVHMPLNQAIFALIGSPGSDSTPSWVMILILGLTAGLCEETARYAAYRWVLRNVRSWREALMFGAGHGGIESIVMVGLVVGVVLLNMTALQGSDLEAWTAVFGMPAGLTAQLQGQLDVYWGQDWITPLLAAGERLLTMVFHIGMAVLVLRAVDRHRPGYWVLAIGLHTAVNASALMAVDAGWSLAATEGLVGLFALLALGIILVFRPKEVDARPADALPPSLPSLPAVTSRPPTAEERLRRQIEDSRYEV